MSDELPNHLLVPGEAAQLVGLKRS